MQLTSVDVDFNIAQHGAFTVVAAIDIACDGITGMSGVADVDGDEAWVGAVARTYKSKGAAAEHTIMNGTAEDVDLCVAKGSASQRVCPCAFSKILHHNLLVFICIIATIASAIHIAEIV